MNNMKYESNQVHMNSLNTAKLGKGYKSEKYDKNESLKHDFEDGELLEVLEEIDVTEPDTIGIIGASVSFARYMVNQLGGKIKNFFAEIDKRGEDANIHLQNDCNHQNFPYDNFFSDKNKWLRV